MRIGVIAATASIWAATMASAQTAPESNEATIRRIIGKVDIAAAALFTANRATLEQTCGEKDKSFHISSGISRFEFAALHKPEREQYVGWMQGQVQSNTAMYEAMSERERKHFCIGIRQAIAEYSVGFMERYPQLFDKRADAP